ncbi:MAG TPA: FAD-dependent oxidoreductase [Candidatus Eisenbacteria bacterium]|jgi:D-amino-acid dehydrogenase|nr:FAD-dependent oxidoreductase [Candidatus Eisenbacteria bacterium]
MGARHVVVIGGGAVGLASADELLARGHRVTIVERGGPDHDCCSLGNAGYISPSHFLPLAAPGLLGQAIRWMGNPESPFYVRPRPDPALAGWMWRFWLASSPARAHAAGPLMRDLNLASRSLFESLAADTGDAFSLVRRGCLTLFQTQRGLDREAEHAERSRALGMDALVLDAKAVAALEPGVSLDVAGGVFYPLDAHVTPALFHATLTRRVAEKGGLFLWNAESRGFTHDSRRIRAVATTQGEIQGDEFLVAAGAYSSAVVAPLGLGLPLQPGKGYSLTMPNPPEMPTRPLLLQEVRVAITPMNGSLRFGGTLELGAWGPEINPPRIRGIVRSALEHLPAFREEHFQNLEAWSGLRPCSPDGLPYVGRFRRFENLSVAAGHAMMGLSMSLITGRVVAEILSDERPEYDLTLLDPDRYG